MSMTNPRLLEMVSRSDRQNRIRLCERVAEQFQAPRTDDRTSRCWTGLDVVAHSLNRVGARLAAAGSLGFLGHHGGPRTLHGRHCSPVGEGSPDPTAPVLRLTDHP